MAVSHIWQWGKSAERAASEGIFAKSLGTQRSATAATVMYKHKYVDHKRYELMAQLSSEEEI